MAAGESDEEIVGRGYHSVISDGELELPEYVPAEADCAHAAVESFFRPALAARSRKPVAGWRLRGNGDVLDRDGALIEILGAVGTRAVGLARGSTGGHGFVFCLPMGSEAT